MTAPKMPDEKTDMMRCGDCGRGLMTSSAELDLRRPDRVRHTCECGRVYFFDLTVPCCRVTEKSAT